MFVLVFSNRLSLMWFSETAGDGRLSPVISLMTLTIRRDVLVCVCVCFINWLFILYDFNVIDVWSRGRDWCEWKPACLCTSVFYSDFECLFTLPHALPNLSDFINVQDISNNVFVCAFSQSQWCCLLPNVLQNIFMSYRFKGHEGSSISSFHQPLSTDHRLCTYSLLYVSEVVRV